MSQTDNDDRFAQSPLLICAVVGAVILSLAQVLGYFFSRGWADFFIECASVLMFSVPMIVGIEKPARHFLTAISKDDSITLLIEKFLKKS